MASTTGMVAPDNKMTPPRDTARSHRLVVVEVVLRVLLFVGSLTAVVVMATSKEKKLIPVPVAPYQVPNTARFTDSPAFVYFVAALSTSGLYSIITTLLTLLKRGYNKKIALYVVAIDVVMLAIVASALGSAGGVAYIGKKGNSHTGWSKICNIYDSFCYKVVGAILVSVFAAAQLIFLIFLSVFTMYRKIPN